ncbi:phenylalanine--tRNA ligase subunit beta [Candidatus Uhrbacteria bacterium]|nr:phenylalanine--tRNA ligase subunit beta [Candidatus Uhrbacteria bacterium]
MNSLVSYNWLAGYVDLKKVTPEEFARRVSLSGPGVEKIMPAGVGLEKIVVGHVVDVKAHPNADKLRLAITDIGKKKVTIVCGGSNLKKGQWVAVALVGAHVRWHGEGDPIALAPAEIRGVKSEGMICAANEIGLFDAFPHAEREILDLGEIGIGTVKPGTPLADALGLSDDVIMDIEVTSNRVDAMGMVGMAREASAILNRRFQWKLPSLPKSKVKSQKSKVSIKISAKKHCPRYMAARIEGITVGPSPWWLKRRLLSAGIRPINNIVDVSNFVLLELAQPIHMFDAATLEGGIEVRLARLKEKITALDGREYALDDSVLVIADAKKPIAIAGIMGGERTGVTAKTVDIVIEAATFDPVTVRRGARKLNIQTDAHQRYEKGLSTEAPPFALARAIELVKELAGGKLVGMNDARQGKYVPRKFSVTADEVNALIGVPQSQTEMVKTLRNLGFQVGTSGKKITATVPWWRDHDIEDGRDLVEEIARVKGYANIPAVVPVGLAVQSSEPELICEKRLRDVSKGAGLTETYTYSFVSKDLMAKAGYDASNMLRVQNPLSADFEVMRTTLLPSLLQVASENKERASELRLFEIANVYYPRRGDLPDEQLELGAVFNGMSEPWRHTKGYVEHLLHGMGIRDVSWRRLANDSFWHPGRSVQAFHEQKLVATLGEISPKIATAFKLDGPVAMVDIPLEAAVRFASTAHRHVPVPTFPEAKRDLAVIVDARVEYDEIAREIAHRSPLTVSVAWFDTYTGKGLPEGKKSVAMHLTMSASDRTLESKEVDGAMEKIHLALKEKFKAEIRK